MDSIEAVALALAAAWGSGISLYATVAILGALDLFGVVDLPPALDTIASPWVVGAAAMLYGVEFLADKIPGIDSVWDAIHTFLRIPAGALLASGAAAGLGGEWGAILALIAGGAISAGTHATKAGSRVMINASPEPFTNWLASFTGDVLVFGGLLLAVLKPVAFLVFLGLFAAVAVWLLPKIWRGIRSFFGGLSHPGDFRKQRPFEGTADPWGRKR